MTTFSQPLQVHNAWLDYNCNGFMNAYFVKHPNEQRSLHEVVEIKEDMVTNFQTMKQLSQFDMDYRRNMTQLKSLLLSKQ